MNIERKRRAFAILQGVLDGEPSLREAAIDDACVDDPLLAAQVRELLATGSASLLDRDVRDLAARLESDDELHIAGNTFGDWRTVRALGRGGMATVYLAQRSGDGYVQQGALKLIKRGMDSVDLVARFRRERQILSRLSHPVIARLLDGGIAADGRPFLVMEHVEGELLPDWSQRSCATLDQRVTLFLQLCDAVAHAHHQLVVHRDIKPANVMVDAANHPRLLDFGIAKVLEDTDHPERTATIKRVLSRAYAAPEQTGSGAITTATDIYQLGALLFELLSGERLHAFAAARGARPSQLLVHARERAGTNGPATISARELHGDPGIIVARACDAEPARRYATVEAFAEDIRRWRAGRPIVARADSRPYRLRRFLARNRVAVAAAVLVAAAIVGGAGIALWQAQRANLEAAEARDHAHTAERVKQFMVGLFSAADPAIARGDMPRADALLDAGAARIDSELHGEPRVQAALYEAMGGSYVGLGRFETAVDLFKRGVRALESAPGDDSTLIRLQRRLAGSQAELGQYANALATLDAAGRAVERHAFDDAAEPARVATIRGWVLRDLGRLDESEATFRAALSAQLDRERGLTRFAASTLNNLAYTLQMAGKRDESLAAYAQLSAWVDARLDAEDPQRLWASWSHARALREFGAAQRAHDLLEAIRPAMIKVVGVDHPDTAGLDIVLGQTEMDLGDPSGGRARIVDAVARSHRATRRNALWAQAEFALAEAGWRNDDLPDARDHFGAAREAWLALVGADHAAVRDCDSYLAAIDARTDPGSDAAGRLAALAELRRQRNEPGVKLTMALQAALVRPPASR